MTDDELVPEFTETFSHVDDAVDAISDDVVHQRLAETLRRAHDTDPGWAPEGLDAYLDVALQLSQEMVDRARTEADEILRQAKQRALELITDASVQYRTDGHGNIWSDARIEAVKFISEWTAGGGLPAHLAVEDPSPQIRDAGPPRHGKLSRDEAIQILRTQMFGAFRHASALPDGPETP